MKTFLRLQALFISLLLDDSGDSNSDSGDSNSDGSDNSGDGSSDDSDSFYVSSTDDVGTGRRRRTTRTSTGSSGGSSGSGSSGQEMPAEYIPPPLSPEDFRDIPPSR